MTPTNPLPDAEASMHPWYRFWCWLIRLIYEALFNMRVHGAENVPLTGGMVIASNHVSFLDPHAVGTACPREIYFLARQSLFRHPIGGPLLRSWNAMPVDLTGKADIAGLKAILQQLHAGNAVLLFPEGTRSHDGNFQAAKAGVGLLAAKAHVPVLPVRVFGGYELWPRTQKWWRRGQLDVVFGKPVRYDEMLAEARSKGPREAKDVYQKIADDILERIKDLKMPI